VTNYHFQILHPRTPTPPDGGGWKTIPRSTTATLTVSQYEKHYHSPYKAHTATLYLVWYSTI